MSDNIKWLVGSKEDIKYKTTTWRKCIDIERFVNIMEKDYVIVGIIFKDDLIGFILDNQSPPPSTLADSLSA